MARFEPWTSGLIAGCTNSMGVWTVVLTGMYVNFALHPGFQGTQDSKVQWLEISDQTL